MAQSFRSTMVAAIALCFASISSPASAGGFTPEGQQHWMTVVHGLIDAANQDADAMKRACLGVNRNSGGAEIRHEYFQVPRWAVNAHFQTCIAYQTVEAGGNSFWKRGDACKGLKAAVNELGKAKQGVDPDEVVALANKLRDTLISLGSDYKDAQTCTYGMGKRQ